MKKKIKVLFILIIFTIFSAYLLADVELNINYGMSKPNLGDLHYLYSAQNDELTNFKNQGFSSTKDFTFSAPDYFKNFGGELKFSISSSVWLGIEYTKIKTEDIQRGTWEYEKTDVDVQESISGNIEKFSTDYDINIFGLNLYWKFPISSFLEIEAGIGISYIKAKDSNNYDATINNTVTFNSESARNEIKITQIWDIQTDTFGGKGGLRLNFKITKKAGIFVGAYYSYYSPKNLTGNFRFTATSTFTSTFDSSKYKNSSTYTGNGEYHIIIRKGEGSNITYLRPMSKEIPKIIENYDTKILVEHNYSGLLGHLLKMNFGIEIADKIVRYDGLPITPSYIEKSLNSIFNY